MSGLFDGTPLERPVTCERCEKTADLCDCPKAADGSVRLPNEMRVRVQKEKRRKGKNVTVISGLDLPAAELENLLRKLKSACAAGGKRSEELIEIQGDHTMKVVAMLQELGYPARKSGG